MKTSRSKFLSMNPFPHPHTLGFFYREKMRAIHRVAPDDDLRTILEVGGGRSGLTAMLYPAARVFNLDSNPEYADSPCNQQARVTFVCGEADSLPFPDAHFDAVTMFDLLEHIADDRRAVAEALRVLRPGGYLLMSSPNESWRYPYYRSLRRICPSEETLFKEWGHVRRGYSLEDLRMLVSQQLIGYSTFISPITALCHDFSFSLLPEVVRWAMCGALMPLTWVGYLMHRPDGTGTETASAWRKVT